MDWKLSTILLLGCLLLTSSLRAQTPAPPPQSPAPEESAPPNLPPEALNQLLAPIALYPDALIALILPASTVPSDVVLAARYLSSQGDPAQITNQPWDDSVKSLANYPDVLKWMDQNLEWTTQVGDAFLNQPADVMNTIQQLRAQAVAAGNLVDTPQQTIVKEETCIRIVPAEPEVIYVPQYDPEIVYVQAYEPYLGPALTFGVGFAIGPWLNYDCDWPRRRVCVGDWNPRWRDDWERGRREDWNPGWRRDWQRNRGGDYAVVGIRTDTARVWEPSRKVRRQHWQRQRNSQRNATAFYSNRRGRDANDQARRLGRIARPSRLNFNDQADARDRRDGRRSNLARNLPGEIPDPGRAPRATERWSRGDGSREGSGRGRERSDLVRNLRREIRDSGPQSEQSQRWSRGNRNREGEGNRSVRDRSDLARNLRREIRDSGPRSEQTQQRSRGNRNREAKGKRDGDSRPRARQQTEHRPGKAHHFKGRKWRADSGSAESRKSSRSFTGQSSRSKHSVRSKSNDSSRKFKSGRSNSHSGNPGRSFSKANRHSQAVNRPRGGSQRQVAAAPRQHREQSGGGGKRGGGRGQRDGKGKGKD